MHHHHHHHHHPEHRRTPCFGVQKPRFQFIGIHPKFDTRPGLHRYQNIGPGCYYKPGKIEGLSSSYVSGWTRSKESEEFSKHLGYFADHILKQRKHQKSIGGPAWQPEEIYKQDTKGVTFKKALRTKKCKDRGTPGPGYYGKDHVPVKRIEEKSKEQGFSFSDVQPFDFTNKKPRDLVFDRSYHLPPNVYKIDGSIDQLIAKITSKRGPYDIFTGARDPSTVYGHFSAPTDPAVDRLYNFPSGLDRFKRPENKFKGKFMRCGRESFPPFRHMMTDLSLCKKNPNEPGPNTYHPTTPPDPTSIGQFGFNTSSLYARRETKNELKPPPGRYTMGYKHCGCPQIIGNGMRSAFLSKVKRGLPLPEKYSWFE